MTYDPRKRFTATAASVKTGLYLHRKSTAVANNIGTKRFLAQELGGQPAVELGLVHTTDIEYVTFPQDEILTVSKLA